MFVEWPTLRSYLLVEACTLCHVVCVFSDMRSSGEVSTGLHASATDMTIHSTIPLTGKSICMNLRCHCRLLSNL